MVFTKARRERTWSVTLGVLLIILGIIAITAPVLASAMFIRVMGWLLIFAAIEQGVYAFQSREEGGLFFKVVLAIVYGVIGLTLLFRPTGGAIAATAIIATLFLLDGFGEIRLGLEMRRQGRRSQWLFAGGILSLVFAGILLYRFPGNAAWTIGVLVGIRLIVKGIEQIARSREAELELGGRSGVRRAA